ncbi:MAG: TonB-dependent receptor [Bacteroidales bacterium]|nr:TonB-dependent receptor [Bacteroidales bacterium]
MAVSLSAQNMRVTGTVTDASTGEGIPFASIVVKGTMNGTSSDEKGAFTINAPANGTLEFSAVGYVFVEESVNGRGVINISLDPDSESLDESIIVAYGTAKKSSFTGSAGTVKSESLQKRTVSNVSKALEGMVAGITTTAGSGQPGDGASIQIRGTGSINASSSPLYVVDGIPFDGTLASINPNDIETMTVLKDASASALYGARAANGVIMITTKRGAEGKANVNFKATVGLQSRSVKDYDMVSMDEFVELTWEALKNSYVLDNGYADADARLAASADLSSALGGEIYNPYKSYTWDTVIDPSTGKLVSGAVPAWNENWMDILTNKSAIRQEYQLGVSGGDRKTKYAFSFGYLDDKGVLITTAFKRYSIRANVDHNITDWFNAGASASYSYTTQNSSQYSSTQTGNAWYTAQFMAPIYPVYMKDEDGNDILDANGNKRYDYGDEGRARPKASRFNAVGDLYDNTYETLRDNSSIRAYATLGGDKDVMGIFKGLSLSTNFGADISGRYITSYYNPYHGDGSSTSGEIDKYSTRTFSYTWNQILKYERTFNDFHLLAQAGHEYYNYQYRYLYADRTQVYPGIYEIAPASGDINANSYSNVYRIESYFGRLAADYKDKYYLEATWRTDGSSRFYEQNRWGQFWSLGGSWRLSQEDFMKDASWIDNLTLRLSYGQLGNDSIGSYYAWQSFYDLTWPNANNAGAVVSSLANPAVSWEKKGSWNVGLEGTFFKQLLNVTLEYYNAKTTDMLLSYPMALSTGFSGYNANVGSMNNQGFEGTIRVNWLKSGNLRASSTLMGYFNRNKVLQLTGESPRILSGSQLIQEGLPIYSWYTPRSAGVDPANGQQLYWAYTEVPTDTSDPNYNADDVAKSYEIPNTIKEDGSKVFGYEYKTTSTSEATASKYIGWGSREPKFQGSFGSDFQWGPVDFSFLTTFSVGGYVWDSVYASAMEVTYSGDTWSSHALRRWQNPGDVTDVPILELGSTNISADRWLVDASYFAIKSIQLGYTLPTKWTQQAGIKSLRLFATGDNLWLFTKLNGLNPQYNMTGGTSWAYTPTRTISLGIDINF